MKRSQISQRITSDYLAFLNDLTTFVRRRSIKDRGFLRYLKVRGQAMRLQVRERSEVAKRMQKILREMKDRLWRGYTQDPRALQGVVDALKDPQGISDVRKLHAFASDVASAGTRGAIRRLFDDAFPDMDAKRLESYERRTMKLLVPVAPLEQLRQVHSRLQVCRLCERFFLRDPRKRAQQYCPTCRGRWTKQQLWYKTLLQTRRREYQKAVSFQRSHEETSPRRQIR